MEESKRVLTESDFRDPRDQWMGGFGIILGALLTLIVPWWVAVLAGAVILVGVILKIWQVLSR